MVMMATALQKFQFTRPRGARLPRAQLGGHLVEFQFTRPRGARPVMLLMVRMSAPFQFTRPRGARLRLAPRLISSAAADDVSIHAPTGGATFDVAGAVAGRQEFQFTRPRGARRREEPRI